MGATIIGRDEIIPPMIGADTRYACYSLGSRMALTPRLDSLEAMFRKLERELVRTFHHHNLTHKADHFYNFCITAHSVRDYFLERLGKITRAHRKPFNDTWSKNPVLVAVADIANTAKHFQLRHPNGSPLRDGGALRSVIRDQAPAVPATRGITVWPARSWPIPWPPPPRGHRTGARAGALCG